MKKVICAAAAVLMVASLTACSGQSGESAAAGEGNTQQADGYPNKTIQELYRLTRAVRPIHSADLFFRIWRKNWEFPWQ